MDFPADGDIAGADEDLPLGLFTHEGLLVTLSRGASRRPPVSNGLMAVKPGTSRRGERPGHTWKRLRSGLWFGRVTFYERAAGFARKSPGPGLEGPRIPPRVKEKIPLDTGAAGCDMFTLPIDLVDY
jgi:hypothetical protein